MSDEEFEEIERIVLGLDEPDTDLYDRVAYLDMVKQHQQEQRRKLAMLREVESWRHFHHLLAFECLAQKSGISATFSQTFLTRSGKNPNQQVVPNRSQPYKNGAKKKSTSLEAMSTMPIANSALYAKMDQCDCAMFADCPLGKSSAIPAQRCRHSATPRHTKKRHTIGAAQSTPWTRTEMPQIASSEDIDDDNENDYHDDKSMPCQCRKRHCPECAKHAGAEKQPTKQPLLPPNLIQQASDRHKIALSPSSSTVSSLSPVSTISTSNSSSNSDRHTVAAAHGGVLFRLPLTIAKSSRDANCGRDACLVRGTAAPAATSGRAQKPAALVNFTQMGLFVAPPSETDPDEPFVVLERHRHPFLVAEKQSPVGGVSGSATVASFTPLPPAPPDASHARRSLLRQQAHSASADNLLIRTSDLGTARDVPRSLPLAAPETRGASGGHLLDEQSLPAPSPGKTLSFEEPAQDTDLADLPLKRQQMPRRDVSPHMLPTKESTKSGTTISLGDTADQQQQQSSQRDRMMAPASDPRIRHIWSEAVELGEIRNVEDQTEFRSLRAQLGIDKISSETLSQYHVKGHMDHFDQPAICYPRYRGPSTRNRLPTGLKLIRRVGEKLIKENYPSTDDKARFTGMFGLHMLTQFDNRVVLTTNERDALAVYDASNGIPALSLPKGERFDHSVLPYLEDFDLVYLWFPSIHERFAKDYASYMNATRCYIITAPLRPVELLRDGRAKEVLHNIQDAVRVRYKGFRSVGDLRDAVRSEIVQSKSRLGGIAQWRRYTLLNNYLRGFRPGEITVISGGHYGKTTFLCEYSMDLYSQGIRTLFCNFEMPEDKILKWMIIQFAGPSHVRSQARARSHAFFSARSKAPLQRQDHSSVEMWLDKFERTQGDLLIMKSDEFRDKTLKEISDAIRDQVITSGIQHLVIDNLQSLVDLATVSIDTMSASERIHQQDRFVSMLRRLANNQELHITLVVHPVNEPNEQGYYELQHIGGASAKIAQEADNVLVIQRRRDFDDRRRFRKFLYILKNRYGGRCIEVDQIEMLFQPTTLMHALVEVNK
ncbi:hypothetical protein niasHT_011175 [Heterodera trifolii]|uniref:SF4 helicase domain-containing protein n=1 Tax=Heterodera trifolii TaxID=157864 RepID=A0ABD2KVM8_9BILA